LGSNFDGEHTRKRDRVFRLRGVKVDVSRTSNEDKERLKAELRELLVALG